MLTSKNRLRKKNDIDGVFKKGRTAAGSFVFFKLIENFLNINRFAFIVSRKISKKAVLRNKIKRRLREVIKKNIPNLPQGFDFLIIAKPIIVNKNFREIEKDINEIFHSRINKIISK